MLPFLSNKQKIASAVMEVRKKDGNQAVAAPKEELSLAKRLIDAVHSKDENAVAQILEELRAVNEVEESEGV